jgi:hypothetical protein
MLPRLIGIPPDRASCGRSDRRAGRSWTFSSIPTYLPPGRNPSAHTARNSTFNENGPRDPEDLDDGLDIDEAGPGGIYFEGSGLELNDNFDEGLDLDEEGPGDLEMRLTNMIANGNTDEGVKGMEDKECEPGDDDETLNADPAACAVAGGSVTLVFRGLTTIGNGDDDLNDDGVDITEIP